MTRKSARFPALLLVWLAVGCAAKQEREPSAPSEATPSGAPGFAEPPAASPAPPPAPASEGEKDALEESRVERDDLASAQAELETARRELEAALEPVAAASKPQPSESGSGAAGPPAAAAPARRARPADAADEAPKSKAEKKGSETSCQTACRAFQSLGRAASSICRLAGDGDQRCGQARQIVSQAERRVTACGCKSE
jgi:hypothetical protein